MDAPLGSNPSFIWRSLYWGKQALAKGIYWKIGKGDKVNITKDNWIPDLEAGKITSINQDRPNLRVCDLLNAQREWDEEIIKMWLLPYEIQAIKRINLRDQREADKRYWLFDTKGEYTVKSGYWSLFDSKFNSGNREDPSSSERSRFIWDSIWDLKVPPKVKTFIWKANHEIIPAEANLYKHHIPGNPFCTLCGFNWANTSHVLFFCQETKKIWKHTNWWNQLKKLKNAPIQYIFELIREKSNNEEWEMFCMRTWGSWKDRCAMIHNKNKTVEKGGTVVLLRII